tara:strand:- start:1650 stop:1826 length:177 start_codon:yes stop_codon:yes gene_type:complete
MHDSTLDLFCNHEQSEPNVDPYTKAQIDASIEQFWKECEAEAAELEITVDYYVSEFMI